MAATSEQKIAIETTGSNIIVSAGAGSGKTFVLKERVLRSVQEGNSINNFIILTFTKKAANEMKERIRKILSKNGLEDAKYVDSAYIATFDSFAHSLVKKYNYLLDIDRDFDLIDSSIVQTEIKRILDDILEDKYKNKDDKFLNLINRMCYKNDEKLRKNILLLYNKYTSIVNKDEVLNIDKYYQDEFINERLDEYEENVFKILSKIIEYVSMSVENANTDKVHHKNQEVFECLSNTTSLDEIIDNKDVITLAQNRDGNYIDKEEQCKINEQLKNAKSKLFDLAIYSRKELLNQYKSTYNDVLVIKEIILELDKRILEFKKEHNAYEFNDIAFKAIELVKYHEDVRNEIRNNTYEIMIDEYQDTNNIQEEFISYIANNNVYMVGDIKQSIYGFRNANPRLFKNKYDQYAELSGGIKIDLTNNFRSREEVVNSINEMFSKLMFNNVGGADYKTSHIMKSGKVEYQELTDNLDYSTQIISYNNEAKEFRNDLIEAYIIADDIKKKMQEDRHALHNDKDWDPLSYKDFCILVDNSTRFETLKMVLESNGIPAYIAKSLSIKNDDEIYIFKNLVTCLTCIKLYEYSTKFKHAFVSIARSYVGNMNDDEVYQAIKFNKYKDSSLYQKLLTVAEDIDALSNTDILYRLIDEFDIINKTINVAHIDERLAKIESFINEAASLNKFGLDIYSMEEYFNNIIDSDEDKLEMEISSNNVDAVNIMTIHGSKGLEFSYVYMPYLFTKFNKNNTDNFILDNELGILIPFEDDGTDDTFMMKLYKEKNNVNNISEKIRLFYVAITRAKEQVILINEFNDNLLSKDNPDEVDVLECNSFSDFITLIKSTFKNIKNININELGIVKTFYKKIDSYQNLIKTSNEKIEIKELNIDDKELENKHFSHNLNSLMSEEVKNTLEYGTYLHYLFEIYDFKNNNIDELDISNELKTYLTNFIKHEEVKNIKNAIIYKEHEIKYQDNDNHYHGFIDLLLEYPDHFDIIDYKTDNIDNPDYDLQLNGYRKYIENKYCKTCHIYLYSIKEDKFKQIKEEEIK